MVFSPSLAVQVPCNFHGVPRKMLCSESWSVLRGLTSKIAFDLAMESAEFIDNTAVPAFGILWSYSIQPLVQYGTRSTPSPLYKVDKPSRTACFVISALVCTPNLFIIRYLWRSEEHTSELQ